MKMNGKMKKLIVGLTGICLSGVIFATEIMTNVSDVQAKTKVFDEIGNKYASNCTFTILEIEPDDQKETFTFDENEVTVSKHAELAYFFPTKVRRCASNGDGLNSATKTCYGSVFGSPATGTDKNEYADIIYNMRMYGLIKPDGLDTQGTTNKVGEFPIFGEQALFSSHINQQIKYLYPDSKSFAKGVYSLGNGDYQIIDGYSIDDMGRICSVSMNEIPDPNAPAPVSDDSTPAMIEVPILTPVDDIDNSKMQLPTSTNGTAYITKVEDGKGNLIFTRSVAPTTLQEYYGITDLALYYAREINGKFYNSDWFREYVFGNSIEYCAKSNNIKYVTKQAKEVTTKDIDNADLIYINGTNQAFVNGKNDLSKEVTQHLYNSVILTHKALMMDYDCYNSELNNNISKLALLLWQESQDLLIKKATDLGADVFKSMFTSATDPVSNATVYGFNNDNSNALNELFKNDDIIDSLKDVTLEGGNGNFVSGNVYVYNHHMSDFINPKSMVDARDLFCNGDFTSAYTEDVTSKGFSEVVGYINYTNKKSFSGSMPNYVTPAVAIQYILVGDGKALTVVKSSLNILEIQPSMVFLFNNDRGSEAYQHVSDKVKKNRDNFITTCLSSYYKGKPEYINFESMSIDEFNGRNEDLIENYDIVYIGTETGIGTKNCKYYSKDAISVEYKDYKYNTETAHNVTIKVPSFKDNNMTGNVYYNIGDIVKTDRNQGGGWVNNDKNPTQMRYAGRDLTNTKLTKLKEYLDADNLILVEHDMLGQVNNKGEYKINPTVPVSTATNIDNGRVDTASNMYELLMYARGNRFNRNNGTYTAIDNDNKAFKVYDNLISVGDIAANYIDQDVINTYLGTEKLSLTVNKAPVEYSYETDDKGIIKPETMQYLPKDPDGTRNLTYEFVINSDLTDTSIVSTYRPHLFIDINNDGKFSKTTEDIKDITITAGGTEAPKDDKNEYVLSKDVVYTLKRKVSEEFSGLIKWKLDVQSIQYSNSHASEQGNTLAANTSSQNKQIKILQLNHNSKSSLNLEDQLKNADDSHKYGQYIKNVPGYDVIIRTINVSTFENDIDERYKKEGAGKTPEEFAMQYFNTVEIVKDEPTKNIKGVYGADMLVLGFGDDYTNFSSDTAAKAVETFMSSGKPVLLSHDFIMFKSDNKQAMQMRNLVGMDIYGVTQDISRTVENGRTVFKLANRDKNTEDSEYLHDGGFYTNTGNATVVNTIENTGKRVAYLPGTNKRENLCSLTHGLTNFHMVRYRTTANPNNPTTVDDNLWIYSNQVCAVGHNGEDTYTVNKLNDGQITTYPYILKDSFKVAQTHGQYFQLDLDADDDNDGESDVVVWYTLGDTGKAANGYQCGKDSYNPWSNKVAGPCPADGYYIYNKGNVTYTGAGHNTMSNQDNEAQLFVNTLFAAYQAGFVPPTINFYEKPDLNATAINGISVPYDKNVTKPEGIASTNPDSSILKDEAGSYRYKFVDPNKDAAAVSNGTPVFFRINDDNFVRGNKYLRIKYYLKAEGHKANEMINLPDGTELQVIEITETGSTAKIPVVDISGLIKTYNLENGRLSTEIARDPSSHYVCNLESGVTYGFYLPLSYLNNCGAFTIIMETQTTINSVSALTGQSSTQLIEEMGYRELTVTKTDLLDLD